MKFTHKIGIGVVLLAVATGAAYKFYPHQDANQPLAFVPADTPYVIANLNTLDGATLKMALERANQQLPASAASWRVIAQGLSEKEPHLAGVLMALSNELRGKTAEAFSRDIGLRLNGHGAVYGLGLSPVVRLEVDDAKAFEAFLGRMEEASGQPFETAKLGDVAYRRRVVPEVGIQMVEGIANQQAIMALLPADASDLLLRQTFGLERPARSLLEDGRLEKLARGKGYQGLTIGQLDIARLVTLAVDGKDPLLKTLSAHTGDTTPVPEVCKVDAKRMAGRVPSISMGYTRFAPSVQEMRVDVALAPDITQAFSGLKIDMPGLGEPGSASLDVTLAIPMETARTFWTAQAQAVAVNPFHCPGAEKINDAFAQLGEVMAKAAVPPFGDLQGVRMAMDDFDVNAASVKGRVALGTRNPEGLLAMASLVNADIAKAGLKTDGKVVALSDDQLPPSLGAVWAAMNKNTIALGAGVDGNKHLPDMLNARPGDAGTLSRFHLTGELYARAVHELSQKGLDDVIAKADDDDVSDSQKASSKMVVSMMKQQADALEKQLRQIKAFDSTVRMDKDGLVITGRVEMN